MKVVRTVTAGLVLVSAGLVLFTWWSARRAEALAPPIGRFVEIDDVRLHYVDKGSGPVVVMLHGLAGNLRNFHALIDRLATDHRVIALDRPDCGYSATLSGEHPDLHAQAALVARFMDKLDLQRPLLIGHSLGGALALALALDHPDRVSALILIAPATQEIHEPPAVFKDFDIRSAVARNLIGWTLAAPVGSLKHEATLRGVFAPEPVSANFDRDGGGVLGGRPGDFIAASKDMTALPAELAAMAPRYPGIGLPVDIIFGRQDPLLNYQLHGERLAAAIPGARLHLLDGGHMIPITQAGTIAELIRQAEQVNASPLPTDLPR